MKPEYTTYRSPKRYNLYRLSLAWIGFATLYFIAPIVAILTLAQFTTVSACTPPDVPRPELFYQQTPNVSAPTTNADTTTPSALALGVLHRAE